MHDKRELANVVLLVVINLILMTSNIICYNISGLMSRIVITVTFVYLIVASMWYGMSGESRMRLKTVYMLFVFSSLFFLMWRTKFFTARFMEGSLNWETISMSQEYAHQNSLVFNSAHSYFFLQPLTMYFLNHVAGFSNEAVVYLSLAMYGLLASLVGILVFKTIQRHLIGKNQKNGVVKAIPSLVAFMSISFVNSEHTGWPNFSALLALIAISFLFSHRLRNRSEIVTMTVAILGITLGNPDGILLLSTFFLFFSFLGRRTTIFYALIPISYLLFSADLYTQSLGNYTRFALAGFMEFLHRILSSEIPGRVMPWQRTSGRIQADVIVSSVAYLSIFLASTILVAVLLFFLFRKRNGTNQKQDSIFERACLLWLLLWLGIAVVVYIGASTSLETSMSDIRTISIVLLSLVLPFTFISASLIDYLSSKKILLFCLAALIVIASFRTVYEVPSKSENDPILVVEDERLGTTSIYAVLDFITAYYENGGIVGDYKVLSRISRALPTQHYEIRLLNERTLSEPFGSFPEKSIIVYTIAGTLYPSIYHNPEAYAATQDFSAKHNRLYDNGVVTIACQEKAMQP